MLSFFPLMKYNVASLSYNPTFGIQGQLTKYVSQWSHLGHVTMNNNDDSEDVMFR